MLSRDVQFSSFRASISIYATETRGAEPEVEHQPWLELRGSLDEPVGNATEVEINVYPRDIIEVGLARPAALGAIIHVRPHLSAVVPFLQSDFDRLWSIALSGQVKHGHLSFTKPRYRRALVTSVSFSNELEE